MRKYCLLLLSTALLALSSSGLQGQSVFAVTNYGDIHLIDVGTCQCQFVMKVSTVTTFDDIAWHGNHLYGLLQGGGVVPGRIFSLDTAAGSTTQIGAAANYSGNAMTSDQSGNLYLVHNTTGGGNLYRYHIATGQHVMLGAVGETVGDLAFMNDTLYAVCFMGVLKRIILNPFSVGVVGTISLPIASPYMYGLATIEDGTGLCISAMGAGMAGPLLYRLNHTNATGTVLCSSLGLPYDHTINGLAYSPTYAGPSPSGVSGTASNAGFMIYPNPVNEILNIRFDPMINGTYKILIMSLQGKELSQRVVQAAGVVPIDTTDLPEGMLLLKIIGPGIEATQMFVKTGKR